MKKIQLLTRWTLPFLVVFLANIYLPVDPDLGWHLRYGEYFFTNWQPLRENIYSSEMPGYVWANFGWGVDLLYYIFYAWGGFLGLSLASAAIVALTFLFFSKAFDLDYWEKAVIFPVILFFEQPVNSNSFRGQLVSMLFLGVLLYLLRRYQKRGGKILYLIPVLFLLWANTHGLFFLGLAVFGLWEGLFLFSLYREQKSFRELFPYLIHFVPVTLLSFMATLINPFGIKIYTEIFLYFNNPLLKWVTEYGAVEELSVQWYNLVIAAVITAIGIIGFAVKKTLFKELPTIGVFSALYFLSLWIRRYSWAMFYMLMPFLKPVAAFIKPPTKKGAFMGATALFLIYIPIIGILKYPYTQLTGYSWNEYCQQIIQCSPKAAEALRAYYKPGKTMTPYNFGGWMIWNYPDMKPSTDGRMHLWRDEKGYSGFEHDYKLAHGLNDISDAKYDVVFALKSKPVYRRLIDLTMQRRWRNVYEDNSSAIFVRLKR